MVQRRRHAPGSPKSQSVSPIPDLSPYMSPLACLCCQRCLRGTLRLKLVPLTHTGVRRNKLYRCMSHRCLGLRCPISLGSPPLWAIPLPVSRLVIVETYHRPCLTGIPALTLPLIVVTLYKMSLWNRSSLLLPRARRKLILLPLLTSTRISDASGIINLSLYSHSYVAHRVHIL